MDSEQFVDAIKTVVRDAAIRSSVRVLENPPGRHPNPELLKKAEWYMNLSEEDKTMIQKVIEVAVQQSVFGMLAVIDGVRVIDEGSSKGDLELFYVKDSERVRLNEPGHEPLHDIFNRA